MTVKQLKTFLDTQSDDTEIYFDIDLAIPYVQLTPVVMHKHTNGFIYSDAMLMTSDLSSNGINMSQEEKLKIINRKDNKLIVFK